MSQRQTFTRNDIDGVYIMSKQLFWLTIVIVYGYLIVPEQALAKPLFNNELPIKAVISAPISSVYTQRKKDVRLYFNGSLSYQNEAGENNKIPLKIKTRGNYRRLNCSHPPLRLNFSKKKNDDNLFARQNKLKLVSPCKGGKPYQELIGLEYLAYKIWQEVSDYHFKTRLLELSYIDTDSKKRPWSAMAFVIEDVSDMAKRTKHKPVKVNKVSRLQLDLQQTALFELFQLLIGNTDFSTLRSRPGTDCCHNTRLIAAKDATNGIIPVPYDFDMSGFVNAPYAVPAEQHPIENVRQRYFSGWCKDSARFQQAIDRFNERKTAVYQQLENSILLSASTQKRKLKYLDRFYSLINSPEKVERQIVGRCRGSVISG